MSFRSSLVLVSLTAGLAAQNPESVSSLAFKHGGAVSVTYNQVDVAGGETLKTLMSKDGGQMREAWNNRYFQVRIGGKLTLGTTTSVAGNELEAGTYPLNFRIDDDLIWHLVVMDENDEDIFAAPLDVKDEPKQSVRRLLIQPLATDNSKGEGKLQIRFGPMAASVPFHAANAEGKSSAPGQNANEDAPVVTASIAHNGETLTVSYNQLMLSGGRSLKALLSKGERGDGTRSFYNERYLPSRLAGQFNATTAVTLGGKTVPAGLHRFTFRIDNDLQWHFVVLEGDNEMFAVPLSADTDGKAMADRLIVQPVGSSETEGAGFLAIQYGPLQSKLPFGPASTGSDAKK